MTPEHRLAMLTEARKDLPEEVRRQLSKVDPRDWLRVQIVEAMRGRGVQSVDDLIVNLWVKFKRVTTRKTVLTRVSEMCDTGEIERVKRGFYKLPEEAE